MKPLPEFERLRALCEVAKAESAPPPWFASLGREAATAIPPLLDLIEALIERDKAREALDNATMGEPSWARAVERCRKAGDAYSDAFKAMQYELRVGP